MTDIYDPLTIALLSSIAEDEEARQRAILRARAYHRGNHPTFLTSRLRQFLNIKDDDSVFRLNVCNQVVAAIAERLLITGIQSSDPAVQAFLTDFWTRNKFKSRQAAIHESAIRDGEYFCIVDWSSDEGRVIATPHPRYTDIAVTGGYEEGDNFGCTVHYPDDDTNRDPLYGTKRWIQQLDQGQTRYRLNVWWPDRIEKYEWKGSTWIPYQDPEDETWPLPWTVNGEALGIPVIHWKNHNLECQAAEGWPVQDGVNKAYIDLIAAGDQSAFRILYAIGFIPTTDGLPLASDRSNILEVEPGIVVGTTEVDGKFGSIEPADPGALIELVQNQVLWLGMVTGTPATRFTFTKQVASAETQKEQDTTRIAKVELCQELFGESWVEMFRAAIRISNAFGGTRLDPNADISLQWKPAAVRSQADEREDWKAKRESGIPFEQIWEEMGYSQKKIAQFKLISPEYKASMAAYPNPMSQAEIDALLGKSTEPAGTADTEPSEEVAETGGEIES